MLSCFAQMAELCFFTCNLIQKKSTFVEGKEDNYIVRLLLFSSFKNKEKSSRTDVNLQTCSI